MRKRLFLLPFLASSLWGLEIKPWFHNTWEFIFTSSYSYGRFNSVQNGRPQLKKPFNENLVSFDLEFSPSPNWDFDTDIEFAATTAESLGVRSGAIQARYLWLDDVLGDPVSLTTGLSIRGVSGRSLRDISCPYHFHLNFEAHAAVGKEWDQRFDWQMRVYGLGAIGMANSGYPWTRAFGMVEGNIQCKHRLGLFTEGYFGFGHHKQVRTKRFNGYADIRHRSIDAGIQYTYVFEIWGQISLAYAHRFYARSFPEKVNFFTLSYTLPFSLF